MNKTWHSLKDKSIFSPYIFQHAHRPLSSPGLVLDLGKDGEIRQGTGINDWSC